MKNEAYEWGYNAAAGQAAYENEQYAIAFCVLAALAAILFICVYIDCKITEYKERKREEKNRIAKAKRKKKREVADGR